MRRFFPFLFFIFIAAQHLCMRGVKRVRLNTVNIRTCKPRLSLQVAYRVAKIHRVPCNCRSLFAKSHEMRHMMHDTWHMWMLCHIHMCDITPCGMRQDTWHSIHLCDLTRSDVRHTSTSRAHEMRWDEIYIYDAAFTCVTWLVPMCNTYHRVEPTGLLCINAPRLRRECVGLFWECIGLFWDIVGMFWGCAGLF